MRGEGTRLRSIDAARGVAALWVLVFHAVIYLELPLRAGLLGHAPADFAPADGGRSLVAPPALRAGEARLRTWLQPLRAGELGVPMFFVISGFCIHLPVARLLAEGSGARIRYGSYARRRFWRLYPTHLAAILGSILLVALTHVLIRVKGLGPPLPIPWPALAAHFAMLQAQLPGTARYVFYYNANLWSLETEVQLYVAYLVLVKLARAWGWRRLLSVLAVADVAYHLTCAGLAPSFGWAWAAKTFFFGHLYAWCLGAYLVEELFRRRPTWTAYPALALNGALIVVACLLLPGNGLNLDAVRSMLFATAFASALWWAVGRERAGEPIVSAPVLRRLFDWLVRVGERSYSVYLWQSPVIRTVVVVALLLAPAGGPSYATALGVGLGGGLAAYAVSMAAFAVVERRFLRNRSGAVAEPVRTPPAEALAA